MDNSNDLLKEFSTTLEKVEQNLNRVIKDCRDVVDIVEEALDTDGAHHKQYALGQILQILNTGKYVARRVRGKDLGTPA